MKQWLRHHRSLLVFILCFGVVRTAVADWNPIPSGSMRPSILEGDVVYVNRLAYDLKIPLTDRSVARLGDPRRGEIVTFISPADGLRLIKRIVAVPGDLVEMRDGILHVDGVPAEYVDVSGAVETVGGGVRVEALRATERVAGSSRAVQYMPGVGYRRSFGPVVVPEDRYFIMGDNRDNSLDSRVFGTVPRASLIGRAERVLVSVDITDGWLPRFERTVAPLR
jgi:signal peptidase I